MQVGAVCIGGQREEEQREPGDLGFQKGFEVLFKASGVRVWDLGFYKAFGFGVKP